jgi:hypothetical protein
VKRGGPERFGVAHEIIVLSRQETVPSDDFRIEVVHGTHHRFTPRLFVVENHRSSLQSFGDLFEHFHLVLRELVTGGVLGTERCHEAERFSVQHEILNRIHAEYTFLLSRFPRSCRLVAVIRGILCPHKTQNSTNQHASSLLFSKYINHENFVLNRAAYSYITERRTI